ncbi:MAG: hypothetical protein WCK00_18495, partial [Deltaproteobacteria bacterium]
MRFRIIVQGMPLFAYLKGMPLFLKEYREIRRQADVSGESFPFGKLYPCLQEKGQESGVLAEHYFYQDIYVARKVFQNNPVRHVDIGSRIDGFVAHVASFREIEVLDVRDLHLRVEGADLLDLEFDVVAHEQGKVPRLDGAGEHANVGDHAAVRVVHRIENQDAGGGIVGPARRRHAG